MGRFAHLHVHTDASVLDGLGSVDRLVAFAARTGFTSLAMTDHGTLANAISFTQACEYNNIKPILGIEAYISIDDKIGHLTLLADGDKGFENLLKLNNLGHKGEYKRPAITLQQLIDHNENLILLSGCVSSPLNTLPYADAKSLAATLKTAFGNRFFAEVMLIADQDTWTRPLTLAQEMRLKVVVTNDVHFPLQRDAKIHALLTQMKAGFEYESGNLWLKTPKDILARADRLGVNRPIISAGLEMASIIADKIGVVNLKKSAQLPEIKVADGKLARAIGDGFGFRGLIGNTEYEKRAFFELKIIKEMGYSTYFLVLKDIIDFAKANNVKVGPGRGSGAGSLVLYLLGITDIDPIEYNLSFERFLNPSRKGMPDVDIDFESERRSIVIQHAEQKWGAVPIATYARYSHKTLVHDLSKALRVPRDDELKAADQGIDSEIFEKICSETPTFREAYDAFLGQIRHKGKHAGGVIMTKDLAPIERIGDTLAAAWTEGEHSELAYAGLVKFDLLGLSALSVLHRLERITGRTPDMPTDGHPAFKLFAKGDLAGIFQFSGSEGIRGLTMRIKPTTFKDLVVINALYRPGALDAGTADKYPEWKKHPRKIHPLVDDLLEETAGVVLYQETVMALFSRVTGGSLAEADLARRVIVKAKVHDESWLEEVKALQKKFIDGAIEGGMNEKVAQMLWEELITHSRYSFNKSHAVSYAMISWQLAWWKFYFPANFYAESLNVDPTELQTFITAAVHSGIKVEPPRINSSGIEWVASGKVVYMPLSTVKFLGKAGAEAIVAKRGAIGGKFKSIEEFMELVPKKIVRANARNGLWHLCAFDGLSGQFEHLGIKEKDESYSEAEAQMEFLGALIPTEELLEKIEDCKKRGLRAGVVTEAKKKESRYGVYYVYKLAPDGTFWVRSKTQTLTKGQLVAAVVSEQTGKATRTYDLSLMSVYQLENGGHDA